MLVRDHGHREFYLKRYASEMKVRSAIYFDSKLYRQKSNFPLEGQLELTYRCQYDCVHCYCKKSADKKKELSFSAWKKILDEIHEAGCFWLCLTGGDPLFRPDFLEIYSYAKHRGFLVTILTNGYGLNKEILNHFGKSPPYSLEITVNGITQRTYEGITRKEGSFSRVMENIHKLKRLNLTFYIKTNCLKQNIHEVVKVKQWVDEFMGKSKTIGYHFGFDPLIFPSLEGDLYPCAYRLTPEEILKIYRQDPDLSREYDDSLLCEFPGLERPPEYLYHCSSWKKQFSINPSGRLKFCLFTDKFSADLRTTSFREGFYKIFPRLLKEKFKTSSKCKTCSLRPICNWCPAKAYLETGSEEEPVPYYCRLTEQTLRQDQRYKREKNIQR